AGGALELESRHVLAVADRPDHGQLFAVDDVGARADALHSVDDGLHLLGRGRRFHHDHHFLVLSGDPELRRSIATPGLRNFTGSPMGTGSAKLTRVQSAPADSTTEIRANGSAAPGLRVSPSQAGAGELWPGA